MQVIQGEATEAQIQEWKKKHAEIYEIRVPKNDDETEFLFGYFKKPDRSVIANAMRYATDNPIKAGEIQFNGCVIACQQEMKDDTEYFLSAMQQVGSLVKIREATLKKL